MQRPDVQDMMERVTPYLHDGIEAQGFERIRSLVEVKLRNGQVLSREATTSRGTPERPMTPAELAEKFHDCAGGIMTGSKEKEVLDMVYEIDKVDDVKQLTRLLRG